MNDYNKLISNGKTLRFGMAKEIAAHAPFRKEFISTQESRDRPYKYSLKFETFYGTPCK